MLIGHYLAPHHWLLWDWLWLWLQQQAHCCFCLISLKKENQVATQRRWTPPPTPPLQTCPWWSVGSVFAIDFLFFMMSLKSIFSHDRIHWSQSKVLNNCCSWTVQHGVTVIATVFSPPFPYNMSSESYDFTTYLSNGSQLLTWHQLFRGNASWTHSFLNVIILENAMMVQCINWPDQAVVIEHNFSGGSLENDSIFHSIL